MSVEGHRKAAPTPSTVRLAAITVSDTRTADTDEGGQLIVDLATEAGFTVSTRLLVRDEPHEVSARVRELVADGSLDVLLLTGGTGLSGRDTTVDALQGLFHKTIPGFGELFRALSFAQIGPAAMLSRATAGVIDATALFVLPGSPSAVRLALERLILPELPHVVRELRRDRHQGVHQHGR